MPTEEARGLFIVGAGPGDPGLMTVRGAALVASADDLVVDALVPAALYRDSDARVIFVGKRAGRPSVSQEEIQRILIELAHAGRRVVRLHGGDPSVFGRVGEEMLALDEAGVAYEVVPGVSSATAAPLALGVAVTERGVADRVVVMTGRSRESEKAPQLPAYEERQTIVLLMALHTLPEVVTNALATGYPADLPAAVVSNATLEDQEFVVARLDGLVAAVESAALTTPATVILGAVARRLLASELRALAQDRPSHQA